MDNRFELAAKVVADKGFVLSEPMKGQHWQIRSKQGVLLADVWPSTNKYRLQSSKLHSPAFPGGCCTAIEDILQQRERIENLKSPTDSPAAKPIQQHEGRKYLRRIWSPGGGQSIEVDVYAVLEAFKVTCPARSHAIKKLLCCGTRGKGSAHDDLVGAMAAVSRAIEMERGMTDEEKPVRGVRDAEF